MFTPQEQAAHCRQLADLLDSERVKNHYVHEIFTNLLGGEVEPELLPLRVFSALGGSACGTAACALGWASIDGVGGMRLNHYGNPYHLLATSFASGADLAFGPGAYERIFSPVRAADQGEPDLFIDDPETWRAWLDTQRRTSIELLRNQAALLETQPELA